MARTSRSMLSAPRLLVVVSCLMAIMALLPARAIGWVSEIAGPVNLLVSPAAKAMGLVVDLVAHRPKPGESESPELAELRTRVEEYKFQWLNERAENERLRGQIAALQKAPPLGAEVIRQVYAPIIGGGADLSSGIVKAKAGEREGIIPNSVAVAEGVHLVGKVTEVHSRYCLILPVTQKASRGLKGVIMVGDQPGPFCDLVPTGTGLLSGRVFFDEGAIRPELKPGMLVRLDDTEWPASARMLIVGRIVEVVPLPQQPNRPVVTVRPEFPAEHLSEVVIRVPVEASSSAMPAGGTR